MASNIGSKGEAAVALRLAGATWGEICEAFSFRSEKAAQDTVLRHLAIGVSDEDKEYHRQLASARYERLLRAGWMHAINPEDPQQLPFLRASRELIDRLVVLHGSAAPTEVVVHSPSSQQLQEWVARVVQIEMPQVVEADVFEIEGEVDTG